MKTSPIILLLIALLALASPARAQQQTTPHVAYVFPAGGRQGSTFQATIGGQRLDGAFEVRVSGTGVHPTIAEFSKPLTPAQLNSLRDQLKELTDRKAAATAPVAATRPATAPTTGTQPATRPTWTADDEKTLTDVRQKLASAPRRQANPALAETLTVRVTIDPNAAPGPREMRLLTANGLSNPLVFCVGQLPEYTSPPFSPIALGPNGTPTQAPILTAAPATQSGPVLTLPAVINGQILPGSVDRVRFRAVKGLHLVVQVSARSLMPFLSDAVPGWFQAAVAIEDEHGREIAFADHFRFDPDPVLCCEIPQDGEYVLKIRDSIYRGREDFIYRVTLGELPFITSLFPLGCRVGTQTDAQLRGWNLPTETITLDATGKSSGKIPISLVSNGVTSNSVAFAVDMFPECMERIPNSAPATAQSVTLPIMINGRVDQPGVWHVFQFDGRAGDRVVAEVYARRLGSPLDSVLKLTDASGKLLAFNDDHEDRSSGLLTQDADSWLGVTLPATATYYLYLGDALQQGGPDYGFRLRISAPHPDFELRVVPAELVVRAGTSVPLTVYAIRKDGFSGEIALALNKAPPGFTLAGGGIPSNQNEIKLTLKAPPTMLDEPATLRLDGQATVDGRTVIHTAVAAEDMMQAFAYRHLVPQREWLVAVPPQAIVRAAIKILSPTPVKLSGGGGIQIRASLPPAAQLGKVVLELADPPEGVSMVSFSAQPITNVVIDLKCDSSKMKPGLKGNLVFNVFVERDLPAGTGPQAPKRRVPLGSMPAIPFEIETR